MFTIENDVQTMNIVKTWLGNFFSMKDLGEATYILGKKSWSLCPSSLDIGNICK